MEKLIVWSVEVGNIATLVVILYVLHASMDKNQVQLKIIVKQFYVKDILIRLVAIVTLMQLLEVLIDFLL
jgi:hypothetical protein